MSSEEKQIWATYADFSAFGWRSQNEKHSNKKMQNDSIRGRTSSVTQLQKFQ